LVGLAAVAGVAPQAAAHTGVDLPAQADLSIIGPVQDGWAGSSVAGVGDVNGDGRPDVAISEPEPSWRSSAYVVFGGGPRGTTELATVGAAGFRILGSGTGGIWVTGVSAAGDVNGDGLADIAVAAKWQWGPDRQQAGNVFIVFGKRSSADVDLNHLTASGSGAGYVIEGAISNEVAGASVARVGDLNGDGRDEVLVGAPGAHYHARYNAGAAYVVYGRKSDAPFDLASLATGSSSDGYRIEGPSEGAAAGSAVAAAGDLDGDGRPDLFVAAPLTSNNGRGAAGSVYLLWGNHAANVDLNDVGSDRSLGVRIDGDSVNARLGDSLGTAGDVNGDGHPDLLLGAPATRSDGTDVGAVFLLTRMPDEATVDLAGLGMPRGPVGFRIAGKPWQGFGVSIAGLGDVNGDHRSDIAIGTPWRGEGCCSEVGVTDIIYGGDRHGSANIDTIESDPNAGFHAIGRGQGGAAVAGPGDVSGDGLADVLIGSPRYSAGQNDFDRGAAFVVNGSPDSSPPQGGNGGGPQSPDGSPTPTLPIKQHCAVPRLKGTTIAAAKQRLKAHHCRLGVVHVRRSARHVAPPRRRIAGQSPRAGAARAQGARVSVWMGA
jgi:hypothetical protein